MLRHYKGEAIDHAKLGCSMLHPYEKNARVPEGNRQTHMVI